MSGGTWPFGRRTSNELSTTRSPAASSTTRDGSSVPTNGHLTSARRSPATPAAIALIAEADAQHDMERRERKDALAAVEPRLDRAHSRRQRVRRSRAERERAEPSDPERRRKAEHRDHRADVGDAEPRAHQQVTVRHALQDEQSERGAHAEERDQHTEPGVGRVQDVVDEHDAEREQRAEPERDRERRRHHRAHQRDTERVEEASVRFVVDGRFCGGRVG